jgi:hypothetical protein
VCLRICDSTTDFGTDPTISETNFPFLKNKVEGILLTWNSAAESGLLSVSNEQNFEFLGYFPIISSKLFCIFLHGPHHELNKRGRRGYLVNEIL